MLNKINKKIYRDGISVALTFFILTAIVATAIFFIIYRGECVLMDGEAIYFHSKKDLTHYIEAMYPQEIVVRNTADRSLTLRIPLSEIGASYISTYDERKLETELDRGYFDSFISFFFKKKSDNDITSVNGKTIYFENRELERFITEQSVLLGVMPTEATLVLKGKKLNIKEGVPGLQVDPAELYREIQSGLRKGDISSITVGAVIVEPAVNSNDISSFNKLIGSAAMTPESEFLKNPELIEALLAQINNVRLPKKETTAVGIRMRYYLDAVIDEHSVSREDAEKAYQLAEDISALAEEAIGGAGLRPDGDNAYNGIGKDCILSAYLDDDEMIILVISKK